MKHSTSLILAAALLSAHLTAEVPHHVEQVTQTQSYLTRYSEPAAYTLLNKQFALQTTDASCSAAAVTMIVNTLSPNKHFTEREILAAVNIPAWNIATVDGGDGISLDQLSEYLGEALDKLGLPYADIRVVHVDKVNDASNAEFVKVLQNLNSNRLNSFLLVNYENFDILPIDFYMGHICPVGGYDPTTNQVLLMDVDNDLQTISGWKNGPHWVKLEKLLKAMNTRNATRSGQGSPPFRGYVVLTLYPRQS